ncbi:queuosine precursor transporter [Thermoleptolyngbya oregonensis NK1-22]|uniref:Probable queuosine precursor transporter n=1 Tax=Thermoleptolyngbya oregonensis NK1-22 TaxID=2547457 RepID=A0AA96Y6D2_9CYAN|nr:queuosine precursor transporter [Thermoleptolyngbya sp. M55_K2018_002]WOB44459.1 queuosine precursor transporter [Thermoleptolyngbya oregonensis NK1-22]HIK40342.1 queuosine precursor transporter [Thermoleptolyngbya sp. M55_K2018_002]
MRAFKHLDTITALFVAVLLISNIASTKILTLGPFTFDGGTILFPLSYIFGDILTEVYGYGRSRRVIWLGFVSALVMAITLAIVGALPPAADWGNQSAYETILGQTPRIVAASLIAYIAGEFSNSFTLAKLKIRTSGRWLWLRTIGSTLVGQLLDTGLFVLIAFTGVVPNSLLWPLIVSNYLFKCGVEILFTPATYAITGWLKQEEQEDYYDRNTDFNPFHLSQTHQ